MRDGQAFSIKISAAEPAAFHIFLFLETYITHNAT